MVDGTFLWALRLCLPIHTICLSHVNIIFDNGNTWQILDWFNFFKVSFTFFVTNNGYT